MASAVIAAGAALGGTALGIFGNGWLERQKYRRAARASRDKATAELLTASADLMSCIQTVRSTYDRSSFRAQIRLAAAVFTALSAGLTGDGELTLDLLRDWRKTAPFVERLLVIDRSQNELQRTVGLDLAALLLPRTSRFFAAVVAVTLGPDETLAKAARELAPAVGGVLEVIAARDKKYEQARRRAEAALGRFRDAAEQR